MVDTVLVTGGHGTMGPWVTRELRRRGARVVVLDVRAEPRSVLPGAEPDLAVIGDIRDDDLVRHLLADEGVDRVVHLAAMVGEPCEADPVAAFEVNVIATARLIEAAESAGVVRLTANSTKGVLGPVPDEYLHPSYRPVPVDHPCSPRQIYEVSKLAVERLVVAARQRGLSAAALRFTTTWGPGKSAATHAGLSFHSDLVAAARAGGEVTVDVHPDQGFDLIYYADVGAAIADACLADGPLSSPVYQFGGGRLTRMAEFAAALERAFPDCRISLGERFPPGRNVLFDIETARRDLGYEPRFDVPAALADMVALDPDRPPDAGPSIRPQARRPALAVPRDPCLGGCSDSSRRGPGRPSMAVRASHARSRAVGAPRHPFDLALQSLMHARAGQGRSGPGWQGRGVEAGFRPTARPG